MKKSKLISGRNPFRLDLDVIDYDIDSEEEFEELNGEDINSENSKEEIDDEEMEEEDETAGWLVPDGYLSAEEVKMGEENDEDDKKIVRPKRTIETIIRPKLWL